MQLSTIQNEKGLSQNVRSLFLEVLGEVLERFAFMFVEVVDKFNESDTDKCDYLYVMITFTGKTQGAISLTAPEGLCREMAANILGVDAEELTSQSGEDAIKELVNILCGELTVRLYGDKDVFNLTVPCLYRVGWDKWREITVDSESIKLSLEGKPFVANLVIVS